MLSVGGYIQARKKQEAIADIISLYADKESMKKYLLREERLQAYEEINFYTSREGSTFVRVDIEQETMFKLCVKARRARKTFVDYFEEHLVKDLSAFKEKENQ